MKLIDSLVKELPKSGGWPADAVTAIYFSHKQGVTFCDKDGMDIKNGVSFICMDIYGVMREEVTKEEFEAALAKNDCWIEWGGGECPVDESVNVDIRFEDGSEKSDVPASAFIWQHDDDITTIIAYRLHRNINSRANDDRLEQDIGKLHHVTISVDGGVIGGAPFNSMEDANDYASRLLSIDPTDESDLNERIGQDVDMPKWNGDGVPPVGTECEVRVGGNNYERCLVLYSGEYGCAFTYLGENADKYSIDCVSKRLSHDYFRPLRTEAEKAREKAITELASVICGDVPDTGMATAAIYAARIYDAGYRKEVK